MTLLPIVTIANRTYSSSSTSEGGNGLVVDYVPGVKLSNLTFFLVPVIPSGTSYRFSSIAELQRWSHSFHSITISATSVKFALENSTPLVIGTEVFYVSANGVVNNSKSFKRLRCKS